MQQSQSQEFGKFRSFMWPIHTHELKKLLPMLIMIFLICFNYTIFKNLKDSLIITAKKSSAEVIPFLKVWVMLPAAILSTIVFNWLASHFSRQTIFYLIISTFLTYFFIAAFILYPMEDALHPVKLANYLEQVLPSGFRGLIALGRNWTLTLFYVMSELWGTLVIFVLFWGLANEITRLSEAARFYSALSIGSNISTIIAGLVPVYLTSELFDSSLPFGNTPWEQTFGKQVLLTMCAGIGILLAYRWMTKHVLNDETLLPKEPIKKKTKTRLSLKQSVQYLADSKYLICIAVLVVSYNLVINLTEVLWKSEVHKVYADSASYNTFMGRVSSSMGIISTLVSLFMAGIIRRAGWTYSALITPIVLLLTSIAFFSCLLAPQYISAYGYALFGIAPVYLAVMIGTSQNCFSRAAKYTFFDATKEIAFIPLDPDVKLKGKAAIDGVGSRLGKSGGSFIYQLFFILTGSLSGSTAYIGAIIIGTCVLWIFSVTKLGKLFKEHTEDSQEKLVPSEA